MNPVSKLIACVRNYLADALFDEMGSTGGIVPTERVVKKAPPVPPSLPESCLQPVKANAYDLKPSLDFSARRAVVGFRVHNPNANMRTDFAEIFQRERRALVDVKSIRQTVTQKRVFKDVLNELGVFIKPELRPHHQTKMIITNRKQL